MNFSYVYSLKNLRDGKFYVGLAADLNRMVLEHQKGKIFQHQNVCRWG